MRIRGDIGIDLGTSNILVYVKGKGVILREPSVIAFDQYTNEFLAAGTEARNMLGRTPGNIIAIRPKKEGIISNYQSTRQMLKYFIEKAIKSFFKPRVTISVSNEINEIQERAIIESSMYGGALETYIIDESIAAAVGLGIDISRPGGNMIVDIGGGITEVSVISLGGVVVSQSIKLGGDTLDDNIAKYIKDKYNIIIGERTAEDLKINIGSAYPLKENLYQEIRGRNLITGLPMNIMISSNDISEAIKDTIKEIVNLIYLVLQKTPPELALDISDHGIIMIGGVSLLRNLDKIIRMKIGMETRLVDKPMEAIVQGLGKLLPKSENIEEMYKTI